jgi:hypothetical protein
VWFIAWAYRTLAGKKTFDLSISNLVSLSHHEILEKLCLALKKIVCDYISELPL